MATLQRCVGRGELSLATAPILLSRQSRPFIMATVYLSLGTNLGNRARNLECAIACVA
jgi:hypothetical protein